jgi:uncharacterized protein YodC (DUF2158 family)
MEAFKKGDVVRLKSGGPWMTIVSVEGNTAECQWFDEKQVVKNDEFEFELLMKRDDTPRRVHNSNLE